MLKLKCVENKSKRLDAKVTLLAEMPFFDVHAISSNWVVQHIPRLTISSVKAT